MKAIQRCEQEGCSLATPLLDPIEELTATEEGSLSGDPSLVKFSPANLQSSDMGEQSSSFIAPVYCASPFVVTPLL